MFKFWLFWTAGLRRNSEKGSMGGWVVWWWSATLTLVVFAALAKCCLSLSSRLSPTLSPPVPFPNKPCFDFSVRPASTMASTIMRKRPSLSRPRWGKWEEIEEPSIFMIHSSICQVSWVSWARKITSLFLGSVFSSLALEFETLWHCTFQMLKLALVEIFRLFELLFLLQLCPHRQFLRTEELPEFFHFSLGDTVALWLHPTFCFPINNLSWKETLTWTVCGGGR